MVDHFLLEKLKSMREHPESTGYDIFFLLFQIFKQLLEENDKLKKKVIGLDICLQYTIIEEGEEIYKYWSSIRDNKLDFGEGEGLNVTVTLKGSRDVFGGILSREFNYLDAVKAGDLEIVGNQHDAFIYGKLLLLAAKIIDNLLR